MIEITHLTRTFGSLAAVSDLTLRIEPGELFGFLGPNGAGKTTTIRMLVGLLRPTSGTARVAGYDVQQQPMEAKRAIGYVPQAPLLYEKLTGREYLRFIAGLFGLEDDESDKRIERLLALIDLSDKADEVIKSYSGGMRQKLSVCSAMLHEPRVLVSDEPLSGLDPHSARRIKDVMRELCNQGATVFMSTHILEIAERVCDRIGILHQGQLIACGTMDELRATVQSSEETTLEDLFLQLTGGAEVADVASMLG